MNKLFTYCILFVVGGMLLLPHKAATQNSDYPTQAQIDAKYAKLSQLQKDGTRLHPFQLQAPNSNVQMQLIMWMWCLTMFQKTKTPYLL